MSRKNKVIITALLCITSLCVASCSKEKIEPEVSSTQNSSQEETNSSNETSEISIPEFDDDGHKISVITVTNDEGKAVTNKENTPVTELAIIDDKGAVITEANGSAAKPNISVQDVTT